MAERAANRDEVLALVSKALSADTALGWEVRLRALGIPTSAVRSLPQALAATPGVVVKAGDYHLVGSSVRIAGYEPSYGAPPRLGEHTNLQAC